MYLVINCNNYSFCSLTPCCSFQQMLLILTFIFVWCKQYLLHLNCSISVQNYKMTILQESILRPTADGSHATETDRYTIIKFGCNTSDRVRFIRQLQTVPKQGLGCCRIVESKNIAKMSHKCVSTQFVYCLVTLVSLVDIRYQVMAVCNFNAYFPHTKVFP